MHYRNTAMKGASLFVYALIMMGLRCIFWMMLPPGNVMIGINLPKPNDQPKEG